MKILNNSLHDHEAGTPEKHVRWAFCMTPLHFESLRENGEKCSQRQWHWHRQCWMWFMKRSYNPSRWSRRLQVFIVLIGVMGGTAFSKGADNNGNRGQLSTSDYEFASTAAAGGAAEVTLGKMAAQKGALPAVKEFGEQMVSDHGKAGERLKQIAASQQATLPAQPTAAQRKDIERLSGLSGAEFDKEYVALMVKEHRKNLKEFQSAAKKSDNAELKSFASETANVIKHHLAMVEKLLPLSTGKNSP
jgi:putative membrane protein